MPVKTRKIDSVKIMIHEDGWFSMVIWRGNKFREYQAAMYIEKEQPRGKRLLSLFDAFYKKAMSLSWWEDNYDKKITVSGEI